jgi:hypothetical protein
MPGQNEEVYPISVFKETRIPYAGYSSGAEYIPGLHGRNAISTPVTTNFLSEERYPSGCTLSTQITLAAL